MNIENVVILAGGKNTRFKELSYFPKVLLPMNDSTCILYHDCEVFKDVNRYLVINDVYENMVYDYMKNNVLDMNVIVSHHTNGTYNTLKHLVHQLPKKNTLLVWSDIILSSEDIVKIENGLNALTKQFGIITCSGDYRFKYEDGLIQNSDVIKGVEQGNIFGVYYYKELPSFKEYTEQDEENYANYDYIEYIRDYHKNEYQDVPLDSKIVEFKNYDVYLEYFKKYKATAIKERFFNKITPVGVDKLQKKCINEKYYHLIDKEIDWYNEVHELKLDEFIPKIYSTDKKNHFFVMENLKNYVTLYKFIKENTNDKPAIAKMFDACLSTVKKLHESKIVNMDKEQFEKDCKEEFYTKVIKRCNSVGHIIKDYDENDLEVTLRYAFNEIMEYFDKKHNYQYCIYHGDPHGGNVMYSKELNKIKFIDPRGYFGFTKNYGIPEYDYAKILFFITGINNFNNNHFVFYSTKRYDIPVNLDVDIPEQLNKRIYKILVGIIWIALTSYISQDVFKVNISYYFGMNYLKNALKED